MTLGRPKWIPLLLLSTGVGAIAGYYIHNLRLIPVSQPNLEPIKTYLQGEAERSFGSPTLSDATVELHVDRGALDSEVSRVKDLAVRLGGTAVGDAGSTGRANIFAKIPEDAVDSFRQELRDPSRPAVAKTEVSGAGQVFVEVRLTSAD
jgi:predicted amidohydrolase